MLPPLIIYPRKKNVPEHLKEGAVPNTSFRNSKSGWITKELYLEWFDFFLRNIPPARPVLLIEDGHSSHVTIELAHSNDIHLLCLPTHTTHILQPLDVGVFKSFKTNFSKACHRYITQFPGRVITTDKIASLVAEAWPHCFTALNILSAFKKCGVYPLNPGEVTDRQIAPSKALCQVQPGRKEPPLDSLFTSEQEELFKLRYEEGYDVYDPSYVVTL